MEETQITDRYNQIEKPGLSWEKPDKPAKRGDAKTAIIVIMILLVIALGGYIIYGKFGEMKIITYQKGRTETVNEIINQVKNTGRVILTSAEGMIILVPAQ